MRKRRITAIVLAIALLMSSISVNVAAENKPNYNSAGSGNIMGDIDDSYVPATENPGTLQVEIDEVGIDYAVVSWSSCGENFTYEILLNGQLIVSDCSSLTYRLTNLNGGSEYDIVINALDSEGNAVCVSDTEVFYTDWNVSTDITIYKDTVMNNLTVTGGALNLNGHTLTVKSLTQTNGTVDLNGGTLNVEGNVSQTSGTMNINGGSLLIGGDYVISNHYPTLQMTTPDSYILVNGDFSTKAYYSHNGKLTEGTLEVKGNFTQATTYFADNFYATGNHKVLLSGDRKQIITIESIDTHFATLELDNG